MPLKHEGDAVVLVDILPPQIPVNDGEILVIVVCTAPCISKSQAQGTIVLPASREDAASCGAALACGLAFDFGLDLDRALAPAFTFGDMPNKLHRDGTTTLRRPSAVIGFSGPCAVQVWSQHLRFSNVVPVRPRRPQGPSQPKS